jgi:hypothetical protein
VYLRCRAEAATRTRKPRWMGVELRRRRSGKSRHDTWSSQRCAWGEFFSVPNGEEEQTCFYVEPKQHPDTGIMMLEGRVARVDVFAPENDSTTTATSAGIRIGDSGFHRRLHGCRQVTIGWSICQVDHCGNNCSGMGYPC